MKPLTIEQAKELFDLLATAIGVDVCDFDNEVVRTLVTIGRGVYWSEQLHLAARYLQQRVDDEFNAIISASGNEVKGTKKRRNEAAPVDHFISITPQSMPPLYQMVSLININRQQNSAVGEYPIARTGHLSKFGGLHWSCYGERAQCLDAFTHWASLPPWPEEFKA